MEGIPVIALSTSDPEQNIIIYDGNLSNVRHLCDYLQETRSTRPDQLD